MFNGVILGRYNFNSVLRGFVCRVMAFGTENRIGDTSSHFELVCCTRFRTNSLGKGMNLSLPPPPSDGLGNRINWAL